MRRRTKRTERIRTICIIACFVCFIFIIGIVGGVDNFNQPLSNTLWCIPLFAVMGVAGWILNFTE